jgi:hypothetical protein
MDILGTINALMGVLKFPTFPKIPKGMLYSNVDTPPNKFSLINIFKEKIPYTSILVKGC